MEARWRSLMQWPGAILHSSVSQKPVCVVLLRQWGKPGWGRKCQCVTVGSRATWLGFLVLFFPPDMPLLALASFTFSLEKIRRCGMSWSWWAAFMLAMIPLVQGKYLLWGNILLPNELLLVSVETLKSLCFAIWIGIRGWSVQEPLCTAPCKETSLQTVRSVQETLICCSCKEQAAIHICRSRVQRAIRISDVLFVWVALAGPSVSLMGRGKTCGIHTYKAGGISLDGKQIPESSGTVQSEIFQLYVSSRASPKLAFPCRRDVQAQELSPGQGVQQRRFSYWSVFAAVLGGEWTAPSSGDQGLKSLQWFLQGIRKKPCQSLAKQKE